MAAKGRGREALYTSVGPAAPSTPGTIDHGAGDEEAPFLDGEPYDFPYEPSLGEDPQQDQEEEGGEEDEEEELDSGRVLPTVDEEEEVIEPVDDITTPQGDPIWPPEGPKAPPAAWLEQELERATAKGGPAVSGEGQQHLQRDVMDVAADPRRE